MITSPVTEKQLMRWKQLFNEQGVKLTANRISGAELDMYFREKYKPDILDNDEFKEVIRLNAEAYSENSDEKNVNTYIFEDVYVGIGLDTGYFQVECEKTEKSVPIYDDLFVKRGLSEKDLQNFVLVGQYIELKDS